MFKKITKISGHKCFQDFKWGEMAPLAKFNLFYGWNGTGKTTLSNLFADLERGLSTPVGRVEFKIDAVDASTADLEHLHRHLPKVRVFNQRYMHSSVLNRFSNLEHIVFFGEKTVEDEQLRAQSQKELDELFESMKALDPKRTKAIKELSAFKVDKASELKILLRTSGNDRYTNYDKGDLERRLETFDPLKDLALSERKRNEVLTAVRADIREPIAIPSYEVLIQPSLPAELRKLLEQTPTNIAIQSLVDDSQAAAWVATGLQLHDHRKSETCIFCTGNLEPSRLDDLRKHFDDSFRRQVQATKMYFDWLLQAHLKAQSHVSLPTNNVYPHLVERLKDLNAQADHAKRKFLDDIASLRKVVEEKQANPFDRVGLPPALATVVAAGKDLVQRSEEINDLIREHNTLTGNFKDSVLEGKKQLVADFIARHHEAYDALKSAVKTHTEDHTVKTNRTQELRAVIQRIEGDQTDPGTPAAALNNDIAEYLGHTDLVLANHGKGYSIRRGDHEAKDLSEGEKTALALLYFLKSLEDHRQDINKSIVVIDDPVSSLDSSSMFTAFGFIKERTEKAKQLIVLTHDFSFFHLVKGWFQAEQNKNKGVATSEFYSLVSSSSPAGKHNSIKALDRLLRNYGSEYQYLFSLVKRAAHNGEDDLALLYGMPNVGRRLLEHFIVFKYPGGLGKEELLARMKKLNMNPRTLAVLNRFLNIHSHGDDVAAPEHDLSLLSETSKVMQAVIEAMRTEDREHVERLEACLV